MPGKQPGAGHLHSRSCSVNQMAADGYSEMFTNADLGHPDGLAPVGSQDHDMFREILVLQFPH